jgi:hypothetical protein
MAEDRQAEVEDAEVVSPKAAPPLTAQEARVALGFLAKVQSISPAEAHNWLVIEQRLTAIAGAGLNK